MKKNDSSKNTLKGILLPIGIALFLFALSFALILFYASRLAELPEVSPNWGQSFSNTELSSTELEPPLSELPYNIESPELSQPKLALYAKSAILVDTATGNILFEKNADAIIPPASMTKIALMYVVFQEIAAGNISLTDIVELPPESWWINAPPGSSLMFLEEGQIVTLEELLIGLSVASGNDAAIAVAYHVAGSVPEFCARMTQEMRKLGLQVTTFVEPSGYSEKNITLQLYHNIHLETYYVVP
jgi:D-alanyl-D-alanine carboxypeptidase (penicillin-binding protein 5/6)